MKLTLDRTRQVFKNTARVLSMTYKLTITYADRHSDIGTCDTFAALSTAIDTAMTTSGFVRYEVGPATS